MAMWDLGRFVQTLAEFEVLPWSGCLNLLLGRSPAHNQVEQFGGKPKMGQILVAGNATPANEALVQALATQGYRVQRTADADISLTGVAMLILCADISPEVTGKLLHWARHDQGLHSPSWDLFNFREPTPALAELWGAVDDVVMGGVSSSRLQLADVAYFAGIVSTENNGGFASVRTKNLAKPWDLSNYEGFRLRVKGDGKRYKFIARCEGRWDGIGYSYSFDTVADQWITVDIPFRELIPVFRAKSVPEMGKFEPQRVYAMQLMLSKFEYDGLLNPAFQAGGFTLGLEAIAVYGGVPVPRVIAIAQTTALQEQLQEIDLPYCLIHCPDGFTETMVPQLLDIVGDRQKVNQVILWR